MLPNHKKLLNKKKISLSEKGHSVVHGHITSLEMKRARLKALKESRMPLVGIFWVTPKGGLIVDSLPWTEAKFDSTSAVLNDWLSYSDHYAYWNKYARLSGLGDLEYTDYPRGRVVFNVVTKEAKIILGKKEAKDKALIKQIASSFNLVKYKVSIDSHYGEATPLLDEPYIDIEDVF